MASSKKRRSNDLSAYFAERLQSFPLAGQRVAVAFSGGLDSTVLLTLMAQASKACGYHLSAVHINHQLSPNASSWQRFCKTLCQELAIPFRAIKVEVAQVPGVSLEAAARESRYAAFATLAVDYVALGHHLDDQIETFFLQLLRGAGDRGLAAMSTLKVTQGRVTYLRPLLELPRADILLHARNHQLRWVDDESNASRDFNRNFLRHAILPLLEERFPAYRTTIYRSTQHLAETAQLLREIGAMDLEQAVQANTLNLSYLHQLSPARARNLLLTYLAAQGVPVPSTARLSQLEKQIRARPDACIDLKMGAHALRRYRGALYVETPHSLETLCVAWRGQTEQALPQLGGTLIFEKVKGAGISLERLRRAAVTIRLRQGGEKFTPDCARPHRSLKNLLQEAHIPPWQRQQIPLIYSGKELAAVVGIGIDCGFKANSDEAGILVRWQAEHI